MRSLEKLLAKAFYLGGIPFVLSDTYREGEQMQAPKPYVVVSGDVRFSHKFHQYSKTLEVLTVSCDGVRMCEYTPETGMHWHYHSYQLEGYLCEKLTLALDRAKPYHAASARSDLSHKERVLLRFGIEVAPKKNKKVPQSSAEVIAQLERRIEDFRKRYGKTAVAQDGHHSHRR